MGRENVGERVTWKVNNLSGENGGKNEVTGVVRVFVPAHTSLATVRLPAGTAGRISKTIKDRSNIPRYVVEVPQEGGGRPALYVPNASTVDLALYAARSRAAQDKGGDGGRA